jgi:sigma-B regulation protein RsbU (phosphoserine phosphatase)
VVIADVSGKGISSALVMSTLQATLHALLVGVHSFEKMLEKLNGMVQEFTGGAHYVTMFLALLDAESRRIHYINAGHNPPVILRGNGRVEQLAANGTVVGLLPRVQFTRSLAELGPDDVLVLYTDGLAEAEDASGTPFDVHGIDRTVASLRPETSPDIILSKLMEDVNTFTAGAPATDDRTVIVISPVPEVDD